MADHFDARRLTGLFVGFAGVAALVGLDITHSDVLGIVETVIVALCYATGPLVISRRLADLPAIGVITASLVVTAVLYAPAGIADHAGVALRARPSAPWRCCRWSAPSSPSCSSSR